MTDTSTEAVEQLAWGLGQRIEFINKGHGNVGEYLDPLFEKAAATLRALQAERDELRKDVEALRPLSTQCLRLSMELDRLRRIPIHYGAPIDDPEAAIRWITGIMDAENGHLRKERDRLRKALETIRDMVVDGVSFNTIARAGLGEDRA